jgi:hypothetical protein
MTRKDSKTVDGVAEEAEPRKKPRKEEEGL